MVGLVGVIATVCALPKAPAEPTADVVPPAVLPRGVADGVPEEGWRLRPGRPGGPFWVCDV